MQPCSYLPITHPITPSPHYPIYHTGDLARWLMDGNIEFISRVDHQVKIRGFRIELEEIENRLLKHSRVKEALVTARQHKNRENYLCAYIVPMPPGDSAWWDALPEALPPILRDCLSGELPQYMIPSYFVLLEKMPINPNGKVDIKALPEPEIKTGENDAAPRCEIEKRLVNIWSEVLGITSIGIDDNFFELGGHSLRASMLKAKIHKSFDISIPLAQIFETPTIKGLANYIKKSTGSLYQDIEAVEKKEYYALSSAQQRLYFLDQLETINTSYNMPDVLHILGAVDKERYVAIFDRLIQRHQVLRTSFETVNNVPVQRIHDEVEFEIEYYCAECKAQSAADRGQGTEEKRQTTDDRRQRSKQTLICHLSSVICHLSLFVLLIYQKHLCCG